MHKSREDKNVIFIEGTLRRLVDNNNDVRSFDLNRCLIILKISLQGMPQLIFSQSVEWFTNVIISIL